MAMVCDDVMMCVPQEYRKYYGDLMKVAHDRKIQSRAETIDQAKQVGQGSQIHLLYHVFGIPSRDRVRV